MNNSPKDISKLIRNPLGIIALFITFIYGISGLVIGISIKNLKGASERLPLIWFVIIFPIIVLGVFVYLVIKHNEKLYAPKDFDNQEGFLIANGKVISANKENKKLESPEIIPVGQPDSSHTLMVFANSNNKNVVYQDAALKKFAEEKNVEIKTEVKVSHNYFADGYASINGDNCLIDVKVDPQRYRQDVIARTLTLMCNAAITAKIDNFHPIMIFVYNRERSVSISDNLRKSLVQIHPNVEIIEYQAQDIIKQEK